MEAPVAGGSGSGGGRGGGGNIAHSVLNTSSSALNNRSYPSAWLPLDVFNPLIMYVLYVTYNELVNINGTY